MTIVETIIEEWRKRDPFLRDAHGFEWFFEKAYPEYLKRAEREAERKMKLLVRVLAAPIIVHKCAWMDTVPEWVLKWIKLDRMIALMKNQYDGMATDSEALAYLMPASLEAPMGRDWSEIYLYLATKVMEEAKHATIPEDIRIEKLSDYQERELQNLKRWIWNQQDKVLRERGRENRQNR